jgi:Uma2 family endonuclease
MEASMSSIHEKYEEEKHYTYADLLELDNDVRAEIINGVLYMMSAPFTIHQRMQMRLIKHFVNFLEGKTCEVFAAPYDVRLFPKDDNSDDTVVEPDIVVVCDPSKIGERGCNGPPDLVIEIVSPSNSHRDRLLKFNLYLDAKVREYWIVYPEYKEIDVNILVEDRYDTQAYGINGPDTKKNERLEEIIPVTVLPGLQIDVKDIFNE